jgi:hypothetical protein
MAQPQVVNFTDVATTVTKKIYSSKEAVTQLMEKTPFFKSRKPSLIELGADYSSPIETGFPQGIGTRDGDSQPLPAAVAGLHDTLVWEDPIRNFLHLEITQKAVDRTNKTTKAMVNLITSEVARGTMGLLRDEEFQCFGRPGTATVSGIRGILSAALTASASAVTVTITAAYRPLKGIEPGMWVTFYNATTNQRITSAQVASITSASAGTFTLVSLDKDVVTAAHMFRGDASGDNRNRELTGLYNLIIGTGTVHGLATSGLWVPNVLSNSGNERIMTTLLLDQSYYTAGEQAGMTPDEMWMDWTQYRFCVALHQRILHMHENGGVSGFTMNAKGEVEKYGKAAVNVADMCNPGTVYFLQGGDIKLVEEYPFTWLTDTPAQGGKSAIWSRVHGYTKWEAAANNSLQMVVGRRNEHAAVTDLATS